MKYKRLVLSVTALLLTVSLSGCSLTSGFFMNKILRPPKLEGEQQALQLAFEESVGENVQLKTPARGAYTSSFVTYDVDADGSDEAFVFYVNPSADASVRINILEETDGEWHSVADLKGSGSAVYEIEFVDFNLDGYSEIIISWSLFDNKSAHILSVIDYTRDKNGTFVFSARASEYFTYKQLIDFDLDGYSELAILYIDNTSNVPQTYLRVFRFLKNNAVTQLSEVLLDPSITGVFSARVDIVSVDGADSTRLFLDVTGNDTGLFTEVLLWAKKQKKLVRILNNASNETYRAVSLSTRDIDGDGLMEIPIAVTLFGERQNQLVSGSETGTDAKYLELIRWYGIKGTALKSDGYTLYDPASSSLLDFPWSVKAVTARYDAKAGDVVFLRWNAEKSVYGAKLFALRFTTDVSKVVSGYSLVLGGSGGNYWCKIYSAGSDYGILVNDISDGLTLV